MNNTIALRVSDFLKVYPPFDALNSAQLLEIASQVRVLYYDKGSYVYQQQETHKEEFYVVHKGAVALIKTENGQSDTIDKCDEGDIFGLRPLFKNEPYEIAAFTEEETILYAIPVKVFKPIAEQNKAVAQYVAESFTANTNTPFSREFQRGLYAPKIKASTQESGNLFELQPVNFVKKVVSAKPSAKIKTVAALMAEKRIGSVIIMEDVLPLGIVTNKDFRDKVATGQHSVHEAVSKIMSSPVICYSKGSTLAQIQLSMLKHKISHVCITEDGTPNTPLLGLVSEHDLVLMSGNNPSVLMKAIKRSASTKELKMVREKIMQLLNGYIQQNIPMTHTSKIIFELNDASIKRIIERCLEKMTVPPPASFAWMSLGSQGRKEQLLHTDQDNAIIFEDVPAEKLEETRAYFVALAKKVNKRLNTIGYEYCNADMMARNPKWCLSKTEWMNQFTHWVTSPGDDELLLCSIFFDYDISYGDVSLTNALANHIFDLTKNNPFFFAALGRVSLQNPSPLGFFRQFLVERDGEHKDFFDLKKRALMPLTDAGRLLILSHQVKNINNTAERFEKLADLEPENKELYLSCSYAAKALLKFRTKHGLLHNDSGRYIKLEVLTKEEKLKLKRCFTIIDDVQKLIKLRFNIGNIL